MRGSYSKQNQKGEVMSYTCNDCGAPGQDVHAMNCFEVVIRFKEAVEEERERCAKVAIDKAIYYRNLKDHASAGALNEIAEEIRKGTE